MFIHDAVLESIMCGNTQIPADDFRTTFEALKQTRPDTDESGFQAQFNVRHLYSWAVYMDTNLRRNRCTYWHLQQENTIAIIPQHIIFLGAWAGDSKIWPGSLSHGSSQWRQEPEHGLCAKYVITLMYSTSPPPSYFQNNNLRTRLIYKAAAKYYYVTLKLLQLTGGGWSWRLSILTTSTLTSLM